MRGELGSPQKIRLTHATQQAAEWFLRTQSRKVATTERHRYVAWLKRSPEHIAAALRVGQLYALLRSVRPLHEPASGARSNVVRLRQQHLASSARTPVPSRGRRLSLLIAAVLAALAAAAVVAMLQVGTASSGAVGARPAYRVPLAHPCDRGCQPASARDAGVNRWG